jgi:predicted DNA-binding WGR domain protein
MTLFLIHLQARAPQQNIFRDYTIWLGKDLLGDWIVSITYGRIGSKGTHRTYAFNFKEKALYKVRTILRKRASANKRSGCAYRIREIKGSLLPEDGKLSEIIDLFER